MFPLLCKRAKLLATTPLELKMGPMLRGVIVNRLMVLAVPE